MTIPSLILFLLVVLTSKGQQPPQNIHAFSEAHSKLDNLIHATSHKVLEAEAAGQALKEFEHNIENYIAWSAHNTVAGFQSMPISSRSFFELQQTVAVLGQSISLISDGIGAENAMIQKRSSDQISKLAGLNEDLKQLKSSLENLLQTSKSHWKQKPPDIPKPSIWMVSYAAPRLSRSELVNWIVLAVLELFVIGVPVYLLLGQKLKRTKQKQLPTNNGFA